MKNFFPKVEIFYDNHPPTRHIKIQKDEFRSYYYINYGI